MSRTRSPGRTRSLAARCRFLASWASSRDSTGCLEIAAAVLPVGIEEQRVKPVVEIVVVGDVAPRMGAPIELAEPPPEASHHRKRVGPRGGGGLLARNEGEEIHDRALLDHEGTVHIGLAEPELGIEQGPPLRRLGRETYRDRRAGAVAEQHHRTFGAGYPKIAAPDMSQRSTQQPVHSRPRRLKPHPWGPPVTASRGTTHIARNRFKVRNQISAMRG